MLVAFLEFQRATVRAKVAGLSDALARRHLLPSSPELTPAGLVRHLTAVERAWFRIVMAGEAIDELATPDDPKAMLVRDDDRLEDLLTAYQRECAAADAAVAALELDEPARGAGRSETLRWIYLHMIEETARHNGHLDLLRESIDGRTGE